MNLNIDDIQAGLLLRLLQGESLNSAEKRELISVERHLYLTKNAPVKGAYKGNLRHLEVREKTLSRLSM